MRETRRSVFLPLPLPLPLLFLTAVLGFVGCGGADRPPLGYVTGTVTMEGEPVDNLILFFKPDVGRAATAITDKKGYYRLEYTKGVAGTKLGDTTVLLEWPLGYTAPFAIPARYAGTTSQLKLEVVKGNNTFDIDLEPETEAEKKKAKSTIPLE